jgi:hypothetical protein
MPFDQNLLVGFLVARSMMESDGRRLGIYRTCLKPVFDDMGRKLLDALKVDIRGG